MRKVLTSTVAALGLMTGSAIAQTKPTAPPPPANVETEPDLAEEFRTDMRKLWEDHIVYTRNLIISALAGLPDKDAVTQRLLTNQDDIGNVIAAYYGKEVGAKLTSLLREHILIAVDVVTAAKGGDKQELAEQQKRWRANGRAIAAALATINPNWSRKELEDLMQKHLDLTTGEVVGRASKNWSQDIKAYDQGHDHMMMFADVLAAGIVKQFPDQFRPPPRFE